jgi:hypothetical protein
MFSSSNRLLCRAGSIFPWYSFIALVCCSLRMYNNLVEKCFNNCVDTFRRKTLDKDEDKCIRRCAEKFLKHTARVSMRFAELNSGAATPD